MTTHTKKTTRPITCLAIFALGALAAMSSLGGCVGYTSWPPVPGTAMADPNSPRSTEMMAAALAWIIERDRQGATDPVVINLPSPMKPKFYRFVADRAGENVEPLSRSNRSLPIYHVTEFHTRAGEAEAIILRPATELGVGPDGEPVYQGYRVELSGGLKPWHVTWWSKPYSVGAIKTPPLTYIDAAVATVDEPAGGE